MLRALAEAGAERGDIVAAVGGGVVGDLAGFCAAIYQRGIAARPGADLARGAGGLRLRREDRAWTCPRARTTRACSTSRRRCICDPAALETLPAEELAAGYAEVVKTALIAGGPLWARVRQGGEPDAGTILGCVRTKLAVVAEDERDAGRRQVLNLGHTVGHAIEAATGYTRYRHGEAVAVGLLAALRLSDRDAAARPRWRSCSARRGLPLEVRGGVGRRRAGAGRARQEAHRRTGTVRARAKRPAR